jgi:hypothetical protein
MVAVGSSPGDAPAVVTNGHDNLLGRGSQGQCADGTGDAVSRTPGSRQSPQLDVGRTQIWALLALQV